MTPKSSVRGVTAGALKPRVLIPSPPEPVGWLPAGSRFQTAAMAGFKPRPRGSHASTLPGPQPVVPLKLYARSVPPELQWLVAAFQPLEQSVNWRMPALIAAEGTRRVISVELLKRRPS